MGVVGPLAKKWFWWTLAVRHLNDRSRRHACTRPKVHPDARRSASPKRSRMPEPKPIGISLSDVLWNFCIHPLLNPQRHLRQVLLTSSRRRLGVGVHFQLSIVKFPPTVAFRFPPADPQISGKFPGNLRFSPSQTAPRREKNPDEEE